MAYTFNGTNQYMTQATYPNTPTNWPMTISCRCKTNNTSVGQFALMVQRTSDTYNGVSILFDSNSLYGNRFGVHSIVHPSSTVADTWYHVVLSCFTSTSASLTVNGTTTDSDATSVTFEAVPSVRVGARLTPSVNGYLNGSVSHIAVWGVGLTAREAVAVTLGQPAMEVQRASLSFYRPFLDGTSDYWQGSRTASTFTLINSPTLSRQPQTRWF